MHWAFPVWAKSIKLFPIFGCYLSFFTFHLMLEPASGPIWFLSFLATINCGKKREVAGAFLADWGWWSSSASNFTDSPSTGGRDLFGETFSLGVLKFTAQGSLPPIYFGGSGGEARKSHLRFSHFLTQKSPDSEAKQCVRQAEPRNAHNVNYAKLHLSF